MKIGVVHFNIEALGGAELVCLDVVDALLKNNFKVGLCDIKKIDYEKVINILNVDVKKIDYYLNMNQTRLPFLQTYQRTSFGYFAIKKFWKKYSPDYVFLTYYPPPVIPKKYFDRTIIYLHYPSTLNGPKHADVGNQRSGLVSKFKNLYWKPYNFLLKNLDEYKDAKLIVNSKFTADAMEEFWDRKAPIIYPPCPLYLDLPLDDKADCVCMISRISPEKRYDFAIEIAKKLPNYDFHFIGIVNEKTKVYADYLVKKAKQVKNVHFHFNCSFKEKLYLLRKSKVLLNCKVNETFGIVFVEAMSSGTIPVSHDSGAPKADGFIPKEHRWNTPEEAAQIIEKCINNWSVALGEQLRLQSTKYSVENFQNQIIAYVKKLN